MFIPQKLGIAEATGFPDNETEGHTTILIFSEAFIYMVVKREDEQITAARYALIAPIVSRHSPLQETADRMYELPGTRRQTISSRTLERYLAVYRKGGWDALKPKAPSHQAKAKVPSELLKWRLPFAKSVRSFAWSSLSSCSSKAVLLCPGKSQPVRSHVTCAKRA